MAIITIHSKKIAPLEAEYAIILMRSNFTVGSGVCFSIRDVNGTYISTEMVSINEFRGPESIIILSVKLLIK